MPRGHYTRMTDRELEAIDHYLTSLAPVRAEKLMPIGLVDKKI